MMKRMWIVIFGLSLLSVGCTNNHASNTDHQDSQIKTPEAVRTSNTNDPLRDRIEHISRAAQGRVGVSATVLETGKTVAFNGDQQFPMQSVYKLPIAMAVLAQVDQGKLKLDQRVRVEQRDFGAKPWYSPIQARYPQGVELSLTELLKYMVSDSDNTACDVLLRLVGGTQRVTEYLHTLGVNNMIVANTEKEMHQNQSLQYQNAATPSATIVLLQALHEQRGLSKSSQTVLLKLMTETTTGLKRIRGGVPKETIVAHKTGTSDTIQGITAATNDVGLVTLPNGQPFAIAVFVSDARANEATREAVIAKVTQAVWNQWSK